MFTVFSRLLASLARASAHRPIHVILITTIITAISYLYVLDDLVDFKIATSNSSLSFSYYHSPGSSPSYKDWTLIENVADYPQAEHVAITPLKFKNAATKDQIPAIKNSFFYSNEFSEKYLISKFDDVDDQLNTFDDDNLTSPDGQTVWKMVHEYQIVKLQEYISNLFHNLKSIISGAETFDIVIVTLAYIAMYYSLFKLFLDMKNSTGSKFWLGFASITSSLSALLIALATIKYFGIKVSLLSLSEGIPFIVATVGFDRVVKLASALLSAALKDQSNLAVSDVIYSSLESNAVYFVKDQILCAFAFLGCAIYASHLQGLRNFCILCALMMTYDAILTFSYYAAILALKIEINIIHISVDYEDALKEDGIPSLSAKKASLKSFLQSRSHNDNSNFQNSDHIVSYFKLAIVGAYVAFHAYLFSGKWVFTSTVDHQNYFLTNSKGGSTIVENMSRSIAKHIKIGEHGTVVTFVDPCVFAPKNIMVISEFLISDILNKFSHAIRDKLISKILAFLLCTSAVINIYLLKLTRLTTQNSITNATAAKEGKIENFQKTVKEIESQTVASSNVSEIVNEKLDITANGNDSVYHTEDESLLLINDGKPDLLSDAEVTALAISNKLPLYALEKKLKDTTRAVVIRRNAIAHLSKRSIVASNAVPYKHYDYDKVFGACCENVIGYIPLPLGVAGPLLIDGVPYHIPMATTEGCLIASTMRGCKAINAGGGVTTVLTRDGMTRGPCVQFSSLKRAGECKLWLDSDEGQDLLKKAFNSTSRFARLQHVQTAIAGSLLYIRFRTTTGDAMGMNMISKGVEFTLNEMVSSYGWSDMEIISVSGNYCTDKKAAAINWTNGRGKSIVAEAIVPRAVVQKVLKSDVDALIKLNISKNLIGSAIAGSIGGFNAQSANLVTAVYLACGQDPAQNVESSNCITLIDKNADGDLVISVSMPSIEVGTIGGGTILEPQGAMLELLGVRGPHPTKPGSNSQQLAKVVASAVLAAELSLCSALAAGHLVQSHMQHNRGSKAPQPAVKKLELSSDEVKRLQEGSQTCLR